MSTRSVAFALVAVLGLSLAPGAPANEVDRCADRVDNVWFVGIVHDDAKRQDFQIDVDNFEFFLADLRTHYCIPEEQATILAFFNDYQRNGKTYDEGTKANLFAVLEEYGSAASQHDDSILFFFLSSHGIMYGAGAIECGPPLRVVGSLSNLWDGDMHDCELGNALNANFDADVRMAVFVDCSFCGGFSDSITALSGTVPDDPATSSSAVRASGIVAPNRIVVTGCAITTECFGGGDRGGANSYDDMWNRLRRADSLIDGFTGVGFPDVQGVNVPIQNSPFNLADGKVTVSEVVWAAIADTLNPIDAVGIQQQYRIKYGFDSLEDDIVWR